MFIVSFLWLSLLAVVELLGDPLDFLIDCFGFFLVIQYPTSFLLFFKTLLLFKYLVVQRSLLYTLSGFVFVSLKALTLKCLAVVMNFFPTIARALPGKSLMFSLFTLLSC